MPQPPNPWPLAVALGIGLLLGVDRERHRGEGLRRTPAGVRTFTLVALLGAVSALTGQGVVMAVVGGFVALAALAAYVRSTPEEPGLTTEVALVMAFLLGVLAVQDARLAAGLGVIVTALLSARSWLHTLVREQLTEQEFHDALVFAAAALVVLPLMPDRGMGPFQAFNPFVVWRLVVIVMTINGLGYLALRVTGPRFGLELAGLVSGFVSSVATIAAMGKRSTQDADLSRPAAAGAVLSNVATFIQMMLLIGSTSPATLAALVVPLAMGTVAAIVYGGVFVIRAAKGDAPHHAALGHAFDLRAALALAGLVSIVLFTSAALLAWLGRSGLLVAASLAGLADTRSAAMSVSSLVVAGKVSAGEAVLPILAALSTNTLTKLVVAFATGRREYGLQVGLGLVLVMAAVWGGYFAFGR